MIKQLEYSINNKKISGTMFNSSSNNSSELIILLHGFLSSKEDLYFLGDFFSKEGYSALCLDVHGHGESEGDFEELTISKTIFDLNEIINLIKHKYNKIHLLGYSMGGYIALSYSLNYPSIIDSLILFSSVSDFKNLFKTADLNIWKNQNVLHDLNLGISINLNYDFYRDGTTIFNYNKSKNINTKTLIIHGSNDTVVDSEQSVTLSKYLKNSQLHIIEGARHDNIFIMKNDIFNLILNFLKK